MVGAGNPRASQSKVKLAPTCPRVSVGGVIMIGACNIIASTIWQSLAISGNLWQFKTFSPLCRAPSSPWSALAAWGKVLCEHFPQWANKATRKSNRRSRRPGKFRIVVGAFQVELDCLCMCVRLCPSPLRRWSLCLEQPKPPPCPLCRHMWTLQSLGSVCTPGCLHRFRTFKGEKLKDTSQPLDRKSQVS